MLHRAVVVALVLARLPSPASADAPAPSTPEFDDTIVVRERVVHFDASVLPPLESLGRRGDADFLVLEAGASLPLVARAAGDADPEARARHLIWLDADLAAPAALADAARALADVAPALFAGGSLHVAEVRGSELSLESISSSDELRSRLWRLAGRFEASSESTPPLARRLVALDHLAASVAVLGDGPPGALWLAVDRWPVTVAELARLERPASATKDPLAAPSVVERASRLLASYGWSIFPIAARVVPDGATELQRAREAEEASATSDRRTLFALLRLPWRRVTPTPRAAVALDLATDLGLLPLARLARPTAGALVGEPGAIAARAVRLHGRRSLVVAAPEWPPGTIRSLSVVWSAGDGRALPAVAWVRTGAPPELAAARLGALGGGRLDTANGLPLRLESASGTASAARLCFALERPGSWLRLSRSTGHEDGVSFAIGEAVEVPGEGRPSCLPLPDSTEPGDRLLLEEVDGDGWGSLSGRSAL